MNRTTFARSSSLALVSLAAACAQPPVLCTVGHGAFAAKYTLVEGTGPCSELKGDIIGANAYNSPNASGTAPDFSSASVALRTTYSGTYAANAEAYGVIDTSAGAAPHALGPFDAAVPDADGFCAVPELSVMSQTLEALPAVPDDEFEGQDATVLTETWTDVRFYVTPAALGTQMSGRLAFTQDGCSATYDVVALYPAISCDAGDGTMDAKLCDAVADPEAGYPTGSGISPDFLVTCDPDLLLCVLNGDVLPVLNG